MGKPEGSLTDSTVGQAYMVQVMYAAVCPLVLKSNVRLATDKWRRCMLEALMGKRSCPVNAVNSVITVVLCGNYSLFMCNTSM